MSRLDRLVRTVGPRMDDAEVLIASVLGHRGDGRGHVALVATDRRVLLVTEGFARTMIDEMPYEEITDFRRSGEGGSTTVEVVGTEARWRIDRIAHEPADVVAVGLIERRCQRGTGTAAASAPPVRIPPVRILLPDGG